jgi:hypothetical protein
MQSHASINAHRLVRADEPHNQAGPFLMQPVGAAICSRAPYPRPRQQRTVYIGNDCLRGTDSDESPT